VGGSVSSISTTSVGTYHQHLDWLKSASSCHQHGHNFVIKCDGDSLVWDQHSHRVDAEMTFYIHIFNLITGGVLTATLITLCFVLADDLHINILKFVAAHGVIVQPASINIVFGCKQAQKYSKTHNLGFIGTVSLSAQNAESHWPHVHITLTVEHFSFHTFCKCRLQRDLMSCSRRLTLQRR